METKKISYCLNGLDREVWLEAKAKAKAEGMTMRGLVTRLLSEYVGRYTFGGRP